MFSFIHFGRMAKYKITWFAIIHGILHLFSYPHCLPLPSSLLIYITSISTLSKLIYSWEHSLITPQLVRSLLPLLNIVFGLVKSILGIDWHFHQLGFQMSHPNLVNPNIDLSSRLREGRGGGGTQQKSREKSRGTLQLCKQPSMPSFSQPLR